MTLKVLDLFAGAGGFTVAGELAGGYETVAFCEIDKHARKVLSKNWPNVPIFEDVTKLHASDIDGTIDVITGGFPCQDLSSAGSGAGLGDGTRSGLFREMLRLACEVRERQGRLPYIIFENVARLLSGPTEAPGEWFGEFLWALAEVGYDAEWFCITAASIGAPHERERVCVVAYASEVQCYECSTDGKDSIAQVSEFGGCCRKANVTHPHQAPIERGGISRRVYAQHADIDSPIGEWAEWGGGEPEICGVDDGVPKGSYARRNGIMGNAIVPQVFAIPMRALREYHEAAT
jgi:DNA (cytosine-5)-methyltransferase 1